MTDTQKWKRTVAQIAFVVVVVLLLTVVLVWTWDMPDTTRSLIVIPLVLAVIAFGIFMEARDQHLDEMEIAARGFAARWSTVAGLLLLLFASFFEPFRSWLNDMYPLLPRHDHAEGPEQMFVLGVLSAGIVRGLGATLLRAAWLHAKR